MAEIGRQGGDGLPQTGALRGTGYPIAEDEPLTGDRRVCVSDPLGNRFELMEPRP